MSDVVIRVESLGKQYRIGGKQERYKTFRESVTRTLGAPIQRMLAGRRAARSDTFWALKDVSFEVKQGEVLGVVGRNGAGKSTLLKILSRITEPTEGAVYLNGRVGSLLEVGTGFHPELTGRENIYLNGAILGMRRAEIARKFDEIVAFAEIEQFMETPVKRYSSGMYLRLGFSVAAHLGSDILVMDEVLAVGDAQFQKKCLAKIQQVGNSGRSILFVSHNMSAVRHICRLALILERGELVALGEVNKVVDNYLVSLDVQNEHEQVCETTSFKVHSVKIYSTTNPVIKTFDRVEIRVEFSPKVNISDPGLYVGILTLDGLRVAGIDFKDFCTTEPIKAGQNVELAFVIEQLPLLPGTYHLEIHLKDMSSYNVEIVDKAFPFEVVETPVYGGRKLDRWFGYTGLKAQAFEASRT